MTFQVLPFKDEFAGLACYTFYMIYKFIILNENVIEVPKRHHSSAQTALSLHWIERQISITKDSNKLVSFVEEISHL